MSITFSCSKCGKGFRVPNEMAGKKGKCPRCNTVFRIPSKSTKKKRTLPAVDMAQEEDTFGFASGGAAVEDFLEATAEEGAGRPGGRSSQPAKGPSRIMLGMLFLLLVGGGAAAFFLRDRFLVPPYFEADFKYLPDNCQVVATLNVVNIVNSDSYEEITARPEVRQLGLEEQFSKLAGLKLDDIHRITIGASLAGEKPIFVFILRTLRPITHDDAKKIMSMQQGQSFASKKYDGFTIYEGDKTSFYVSGEKTIVAADDSQTLLAILTRQQTPKLSLNIRSALRRMNVDRSALAIVVDATAVTAGTRTIPLVPAVPSLPTNVDNMRAFALQLNMTDTIDLKVFAIADNEKTAQAVKNAIDKVRSVSGNVANASADLPEELKSMVNSIRTSRQGETVTIVMGTSVAKIANLVKGLEPFLQFLPPNWGGDSKEDRKKDEEDKKEEKPDAKPEEKANKDNK
ncbi:MAG: hypothetical protein KatS3mg105_4695 [Gemmatales bacterium]|nr:MAG: hypothetical protein KatS3mg105_4695 [Gemmatales bacterium]